ncbi:hypothetical protein [Achromobacter aloeverae]
MESQQLGSQQLGSQQPDFAAGLRDASWEYAHFMATGPEEGPVVDAAYAGLAKDKPRYANYTEADASLHQAADICSLAAVSSNDDQRRRIMDGAAAAQRGADEARSAALKRAIFGGIAGVAAVAGGAYATYSAFKASPAGLKEIEANNNKMAQMKSERDWALKEEAFMEHARQSQARSKAPADAGGETVPNAGEARLIELDAGDKTAAARDQANHQADAERYMRQANEARQKKTEAAYLRETANLDGQSANSERTRRLESARNSSTLATGLSGLANAGSAWAGLNEAARIGADAAKNQADAYGGLSGSAKQNALSQQTEMVNAKKAMYTAEYQRLLATLGR